MKSKAAALFGVRISRFRNCGVSSGMLAFSLLAPTADPDGGLANLTAPPAKMRVFTLDRSAISGLIRLTFLSVLLCGISILITRLPQNLDGFNLFEID